MGEILADYNGYDYKGKFWSGREYEDLSDRKAIQRLLPKQAKVFIDIAGGYGRLANEYLPKNYKKTIIFDYSKTLLADAKKEFGDKITTVQGDIYDLPFKDGEADAMLMVRATHHFDDLPAVIKQLARVLAPNGTLVIELANKKTLAKIFKYWAKKSDINPFSHEPSKLKELNKGNFYNYHPKYIEQLFAKNGLKIERVLSVSNFRSPRLKKLFGHKLLAKLESPLQYLLAPLRFGPSIYYQVRKVK
ncbi:MAG: class I SAM-dependent methyltransferase [Candidatus Nomurabacteria bacterium]|jgi:ubiquinone/menaquinone biosynthesis C-methylase UbiE|nr:class I SAM-dependent methyltransferase [Candidatus Nomurabacteria bacterium]